MRISLTMALLLISSSTLAASFDCSRASTLVEQSICANKKLSDLDDSLAVAYKKATVAGTSDAVRNRQREWLRNERNQCQDIACLSNAYTQRIAELTGPMGVNAAQPSPMAVCDGMVSRLRAAPQDHPWDVLTKGARPFVETSGDSATGALVDNAADDADVVNRFVSKFNPSDDLRKSWVEVNEWGHVEVGALANSDLHVVTNTGGSANCVSFMFFQAPKGRQAQLLPALPLKSDRDGENAICNKSGSDGYLARVGGAVGFLETREGNNNHSYRFVPLRDGHWEKACAVDAEYRTRYATSKAFVPAKGPLTEAELKKFAAEIVERREAVKDAKDFSYGLPLPEKEKAEVGKLTELVEKMDGEPVPTFGRNGELSSGEERLVSGESLHVVLNGHAWLLRLGAGQLGCCYFPGPILILYTLKDGKPEAIGAAIVDKSRGPLRSASARSSR